MSWKIISIITKKILLYLNPKFQLTFKNQDYIDSESGPKGLWIKFPRLHYVYNNSIYNKDALFVSPYLIWLDKYNNLDKKKITDHIKTLNQFLQTPKISVIVTVFNPNIKWLVEALDSVRSQLYTNWELCIADDCSTMPEVSNLLNNYSKLDNRIKFVIREMNGHISAASNSALALATGEWVAFLDQDDLISEDALYQIANVIIKNPTAAIIYSDEDKINDAGVRDDPHFKPDWNQDLFYSYNMISHLGVYHKPIVDDVGSFREHYEGAQDYDLALRITEKIRSDQIHHIPKVLYHWRVHPNSTAGRFGAKPYAVDAGRRALQEHFMRIGSKAQVEIDSSGFYRIRHSIPDQKPLVTIVIPSYNKGDVLKQCINSILKKTLYENYEILIIDNRSNEHKTLLYLESINQIKKVRVIRDNRPFNYSALNNYAVCEARGDILCFLNNDTEIISRCWLDEMTSHAVRPDIGAVGSKLIYPNGKIQHAGVILGINGGAGHAFKYASKLFRGYMSRLLVVQNYTAVTGACLVIEKHKFQKIGGFDEVNLPISMNDIDLCLKLVHAGYRNLWTPHALLYHKEGLSRGDDMAPINIERFNKEVSLVASRWEGYFSQDPAYSPNLTIVNENFSLAFPPRVC